VDDILIHTYGQPYLIQYLCQRLFESDGEEGHLRHITDEDLATDHILAGFFQIDFSHLSKSERRLVLAVADLTIAKRVNCWPFSAISRRAGSRCFSMGWSGLAICATSLANGRSATSSCAAG
jgi:hypothetical protein